MSSSYKNLATRRQFVVLASGSALGCAAMGCSFRRPYDAQAIDLRGFNLVDDSEDPLDMSVSRDLNMDLREPPPPDLQGVDLQNADLRPPPDMRQPDLSPPPDLTPPPPDLACGGNFVATGAKTLGLNQARVFPAGETIVARDGKGFYAMWYRCRHAGCPTNYNTGAASFDCPCHGSRFRFDGTVLQGPATLSLFHRRMCRQNGDPSGELVVDTTDAGLLSVITNRTQ